MTFDIDDINYNRCKRTVNVLMEDIIEEKIVHSTFSSLHINQNCRRYSCALESNKHNMYNPIRFSTINDRYQILCDYNYKLMSSMTGQ